MTIFSCEFLSALGAWQNGWEEDKIRRLQITNDLKVAIKNANLPPEAFCVPEICYRKRFLVPNNPQNGGDFIPLAINNEILDGVASWTTDFAYAKMFKKEKFGPRLGCVAAIFGWRPTRNEVVLNVSQLWKNNEFKEAVSEYTGKGGENARALNNFRDLQSEVILESPLKLSEVLAFCGAIPTLRQICEKAGVTAEAEEDEIWERLVKMDLLAPGEYWVEGEAALRSAITMIEQLEKILERLEKIRIE